MNYDVQVGRESRRYLQHAQQKPGGITPSDTGKRLNESTSLIESRLKPGPLLELGRGDNYARLQLQKDTARKVCVIDTLSSQY